MKSKNGVNIFVVILFSISCATANAWQLTNGSFEAPQVLGGAKLSLGDTLVTGWTVGGTGLNVSLENNVYYALPAYDGAQCAVFGGGETASGGSLFQTLVLEAGKSYRVTYEVGEVGSTDGSVSLTASILGGSGDLLASTVCAPAVDSWTQFQTIFTAETTNETLVFTDTSAEDYIGDGILLDAVAMVEETTNGAPLLIFTPASQTVLSGTTVTLRATAAGAASTLQWYLGTNAITTAGGTTSPLVFTADDATAGNYFAVFSNSFGMATTAVAVLTVLDPPVITGSPASQTATAQTLVQLTATATGALAGTEWFHDGHPVGPSTNVLSFLAVAGTAGNSGDYYARFTGPGGSTLTATALVTVVAAPFVNGDFEIQTNRNVFYSPTYLSFGDTWLLGWSFGTGYVQTTIGGVSLIPEGAEPLPGLQMPLPPFSGQDYVELSVNVTPAFTPLLSQTFRTVPGQSYQVTFASANLDENPQFLAAVALDGGGAVLATKSCALPTNAPNTWTLYSLQFTAISTNSTLAFGNGATNFYSLTADLDDVVLSIAAGPPLAISPTANGLTLSWQSSPTVLAPQWTTNLGGTWANTVGTIVTNGITASLTVPTPTQTTFYRLHQP